MTSLDDYLETVLRQGWKWGQMDCCMFAGNWIEAASGRDAMARYRGLYSSALQAARLIRQRGGLVAMVDAEMQRCGFERLAPDVPAEHGDIAVIAAPAGLAADHRAADASVVIRHSCLWVARAIDGVVGIDAVPLAAWRVR